MNGLKNEVLIEAYLKANELGLEDDFIQLLREELLNRNLNDVFIEQKRVTANVN